MGYEENKLRKIDLLKKVGKIATWATKKSGAVITIKKVSTEMKNGHLLFRVDADVSLNGLPVGDGIFYWNDPLVTVPADTFAMVPHEILTDKMKTVRGEIEAPELALKKEVEDAIERLIGGQFIVA